MEKILVTHRRRLLKKLLYQRIENVGKIKAQDIYYSYDYSFAYDPKQKSLYVKEEQIENAILGFYGSNIEGITLLVGENGAGKTTIMELLALPDAKYKKRFSSPYFKNMSWFAVYKMNNDGFLIEGTGALFDESTKGNIRQYCYGVLDEKGKFCVCLSSKMGKGENNKDILVYRPTELGLKNIYSDVLRENGDKQIFVDASAEVICDFLLHDYYKYSGCHRLGQHEFTIIQDDPTIDVTIESRYTDKEIFMLGLWENAMDRIEEYCTKKKELDKLKLFWEAERKGVEIDTTSAISEEFIHSLFDDSYRTENKKHLPHEYFDYYIEHIEDEKLKKMYVEYANKYVFDDSECFGYSKCFDEEKDLFLKNIVEYFTKRENLYQRIPKELYVARNCIKMAICPDNEKYFGLLQFAHSYSFSSYLYDEDSITQPILRTEFTSMSTGEKVFIGMFAGMITNMSDMDNNSIGIICLDEPDNFLHPEWSRTFLNSFIKYLKNCNGKYQVIITSHSPMMTSDLLKRDIWCLNGEGVIEQSQIGWMSNIHNVYQDVFYLKSTFGELGKNRLKEMVIDRLNMEEQQDLCYEKILELTNEVCDPILKKALVMQIEQKKSGE